MEEVIWIGVVILWMIGAAQRGAKRKAEREAGMDAAASSPTKQKPDWRDRILEAAKEWEQEQRHEAGELPGLPEGTRLESEEHPRREQGRSRLGAGAERAERQRYSAPHSDSVLVRDVTPDRTAAVRGRSTDQLPIRVESRAVARRPTAGGSSRMSARRTRSSEPRRKLAAASSQKTRGAESAGEDFLARLERYTPLRRAIVLTEILGRPKGLE